jgi:hypothetical protein
MLCRWDVIRQKQVKKRRQARVLAVFLPRKETDLLMHELDPKIRPAGHMADSEQPTCSASEPPPNSGPWANS